MTPSNGASDILPRHPIRVVAHRTGLTPATLRAWERRYGVVEPHRSEGGQRLYSDRDVERLLRMKLLSEGGRAISLVAGLADGEAEALLEEDRTRTRRPGRDALGAGGTAPPPSAPLAPSAAGPLADRAFGRVLAMDAEGLDVTLRKAAVTLGAHPFLEEVVAPLLHRVGVAWTEGDLTPSQEHLCTSVVERVLGWLAEPVASESGDLRLVVATLQGERHGLGARLVAAAAALDGWRVTHLGTDLPAAEIAAAARAVGASAVAVSLVNPDLLAEAGQALAELRVHLGPDVPVLLGGGAARLLAPADVPAGARVVAGLVGLRQALSGLA